MTNPTTDDYDSVIEMFWILAKAGRWQAAYDLAHSRYSVDGWQKWYVLACAAVGALKAVRAAA